MDGHIKHKKLNFLLRIRLEASIHNKHHKWEFHLPHIRQLLTAKYTEQNYKRNTFVFAPIYHELNSKI